MRRHEELLLHVGMLLADLTSDDHRAQFLETLRSNEEGSDRVWVYTQKLRDRLTELLQKAGRE